MATPPDHDPHEPPSSIRTDARLDLATRQKVDDLAQHFGRPRAVVLCQIMAWGLSRAQTGPLDEGEAQGPVRHLSLYVDAELHARVEKAVAAAELKAAPWLRQITISDFPASWQEERSEEGSHHSRTYGTRFMLRLDETAQTKLQQLLQQFGASKAQIIRQVVVQATPENFPKSWQMRAAESSMPPMRQQTGHNREITR